MNQDPGEYASVQRLLLTTMDELSNGERKVARALLAQYPAAGLTTVADLAASAGVSPPTVVRFVTRLGFGGFPAFQRALVHELNGERGSPLKQYAEKASRSGQGILPETRQAFADMLQATYDEVPESEFAALVKMLCDPGRDVRVAGGRFSRLVAEYLVVHLWLLRDGVQLVGTDEMDRRRTIADAGPGTVFLMYDYRRYSQGSLRLAEGMAERGATVCLMTDNWLSPIAKLAKVVLPVRVESASAFDSLVAAMALSESVVAAVSESLGEAGKKRLELVEESLAPE
ncbi:MurR/RpiR family transcriptional regulator [Actinomadura viridis]|uniref:DNA-binding MurR/RpiR family transcriptional regulator n=1 Tax=Actinomadura viridis TaxID=58110 RepID=A0A931DHY5_9ACTN|nr:MurR/RpiR family transcriptional regulator [Actinomadura viridis]MBG6090385.1 DNA-binding MurR/RpiR family transcriptional regulator [Actinomadura viridis]